MITHLFTIHHLLAPSAITTIKDNPKVAQLVLYQNELFKSYRWFLSHSLFFAKITHGVPQ